MLRLLRAVAGRLERVRRERTRSSFRGVDGPAAGARPGFAAGLGEALELGAPLQHQPHAALVRPHHRVERRHRLVAAADLQR